MFDIEVSEKMMLRQINTDVTNDKIYKQDHKINVNYVFKSYSCLLK